MNNKKKKTNKKPPPVLKETDYFLCTILPQSSYFLFLPDLTATRTRRFCCTLNQKYDPYLETPLKNIFFCQFSVTSFNNKHDYWTLKVSMFGHLPEFTYCSCREERCWKTVSFPRSLDAYQNLLWYLIGTAFSSFASKWMIHRLGSSRNQPL